MDMPKWPKQLTGEFTLTSGWLAANYERAMKEAYAARLRMAVTALESMRYLSSATIDKALADIGELPPDRK
jgi:hypothetical protein